MCTVIKQVFIFLYSMHVAFGTTTFGKTFRSDHLHIWSSYKSSSASGYQNNQY